MSQTQILLIDCPDQKGLVHGVSGVMLGHGANIITNDEFVDRETGHFFMRTVAAGQLPEAEVLRELREVLPASARVRIAPKRRKQTVVFASREHHCLGDLLIRHSFSELRADIRAVISNHDTLAPLAERFGVPYHHVPHDGLSRQEHEAQVLALLERYDPELLVLAKYMRILTPGFVARFEQRILNIHHSFLPAFVGANPYRQAYQRGVKIIGATAHFVTEELDEGPIIAQSVIPVDHTRSAGEMAQAGRDVEKVVLARALQLVCEDRVFVNGRRTVIFD